ncbi:MAG: hypothetical protein JNL81_04030 [Hyphomonadaceae bacterium]|nr:hypothetical protein [Hyphomonadaceae bacterium]
MIAAAAPLSLDPALAAFACALVVIGVASALVLTNAVKRLAGLVIAGIGALAALAVLGAPAGALTAGVAVLFAQVALGAAIVVRLQESYGSVASSEIDGADLEDDARGSAS